MNKPDYSALYKIVEDQGGYFTAAQARKVGFSWERLSNNVKSNQFERVFRGVYRFVKFPSSRFEDLFVAWLRAGPESVISHESALSVYELSDIIPSEIHVIVPRTASRRGKGIKYHTNKLEEYEVTRREGLPVTTLSRTLADISKSGVPEEQVVLAIREGIEKGLVSFDMLRIEADKRGGRFDKILNNYKKIENI